MRLSNDALSRRAMRRHAAERAGAGYLGSLAAAVTAACAAYYFDPQSGRRRRALLRDQGNHMLHQFQDYLGKAKRDARHRLQGMYERIVAHFRPDHADDRTIQERVRAELGRLSSHPGAIEVTSEDGIVRLRGDILEDEVAKVVRGVSRVRGVEEVVNEMRVHGDATHVPALQGGEPVHTPRSEFLQENWSPAPRLLAGTLGATLVAAGLGRRSLSGSGMATGGALLLLRSVCNAPLMEILGLREPQDGLLVQKTLHVNADAKEAYACWRALETFPAFMSHVREVRKIDDTHYHWTVDGPAGMTVEWDAEITADVPGELIAWRTVKDSAVRSMGIVQFEPDDQGGTRIHVRMSYRPPANAVGHTIAKVFGRDPKRQIDADLMRFKTYLEAGRDAGREGSQTRH